MKQAIRAVDLSHASARWLLPALLAAQCVFALPYWLNASVPHNDTMHVYLWFAFFYNEVFWHNVLPQWIPFGFYGLQSDYFPTLLGPAQFAVGVAGWILRIENIYALFKASLFIEQLILLYGVHLLAGHLFRHTATRAVVALSVIGSSYLMFQLVWNFRAFYLLPLVLYLVLKGLREHRLLPLAAGLMAFALMQLGNMLYLLPIQMLVVGGFAAMLILFDYACCRTAWRGFLRVPRMEAVAGAGLLVLLALLLSSQAYLAHKMMEDVHFYSEGRDPQTGVTDRDTYLTYAPSIGPQKFTRLWDPRIRSNADVDLTLYQGILILPLALLGLFHGSRAVRAAIVSILLVLGLISLGRATPIAGLFYDFFPFMHYFRHIGYVVYPSHILLPLLAGYGLEALLDSRESTAKRRLWLLTVALAGCAFSAAYALFVYADSFPAALPWMLTALGIVTLWPLWIAFAPRQQPVLGRRTQCFAAWLVAALCLDLLAFQALQVTTFAPQSRPIQSLIRSDALRTHRYAFPAQRTGHPSDARAVAIASAPSLGVSYSIVYAAMQWDPALPTGYTVQSGYPAIPPFRVDMLNRHVADLIAHLDGIIEEHRRQLANPILANVIGFRMDKLRVYTRVEHAASEEAALWWLTSSSPADYVPVLLGPAILQETEPDGPEHPTLFQGAHIHVTDYRANRIELTANAPTSGPAWLYFADAWHADWRAWVNGHPVPVLRANYAFKAVPLDPGPNTIRMEIDDPMRRAAAHTVVWFGIGFVLLICAGLIRALKTNVRTGNPAYRQ